MSDLDASLEMETIEGCEAERGAITPAHEDSKSRLSDHWSVYSSSCSHCGEVSC